MKLQRETTPAIDTAEPGNISELQLGCGQMRSQSLGVRFGCGPFRLAVTCTLWASWRRR